MKLKKITLIAAAGLLAAGVGLSCKSEDLAERERTIYVQATEMDARRTLDQDPFPEETLEKYPEYFGSGDDPFERGGQPGYYLFMTNENEWRIGSYLFVPQEVIAYQGERITLEVFGVRGSHHENFLVDPDGERVKGTDGEEIFFNVKRGELHSVEFVAEKPGIYRLICETHLPTMTMNIHVLPK